MSTRTTHTCLLGLFVLSQHVLSCNNHQTCHALFMLCHVGASQSCNSGHLDSRRSASLKGAHVSVSFARCGAQSLSKITRGACAGWRMAP